MFKFGLKNLRRLKDVPPVGIVPITILVGRNSSGKSSFLRALPLLRQSIMTRTSSPILWFGDYVDFGGYAGAVSDNDTTKSISFLFHLDSAVSNRRGRFYDPEFGFTPSVRFAYSDIGIEIAITPVQDDVRIQSICVTIGGGKETFLLTIDAEGVVKSLLLDNEDMLPLFKTVKMIVSRGSIFPDILIVDPSRKDPNAPFNEAMYYGVDLRILAASLGELLSPYLDKRIKPEVLLELSTELLSLETLNKADLAEYSKVASVRSWKKLLTDIGDKDEKKLHAKIARIHAVARLVPLLRAITGRLRQIVTETLYIGPARARSERYYRYQDLAVAEIDSDGKNFAMFLNSLQADQLNALSDWVQSLFGYRISLSKPAGHISINLVEEGSETNIVDTGYGVSQILPVLGQIWWAANREDTRQLRSPPGDVAILAIEQPELHLHPAHQSFLADALANPPKKAIKPRQQTHFVIETHSETLVNRLGELISEGKLAPKDVQIVLFEADEKDKRRTNTRIAQFNSDGVLIDWPYGFFQPSA